MFSAMRGCQVVKNFHDMFSRFDAVQGSLSEKFAVTG